MIKRFFRWLFTDEPLDQQQQATPEESLSVLAALGVRDGSEDALTDNAKARKTALMERIAEIVMPITPKKGMTALSAVDGKEVIPAPGAKSAMDGLSAPGSNTAFTMSGQTSIPDAQLLWYASYSFPGYQVLAMIAQHWLVAKAISMPVKDAIRNGYTITTDDGNLPPEVQAYIIQKDKQHNVKKKTKQFVRFGRMFGIRVAMFRVAVDDPVEYYKNPFNPDAVRPGTYRGFTQIDPYWMAPMLDASAISDPTAEDFYVPTWWQINGMAIHRSHLCIYLGEEVADVLKPSYRYGGISLVQRIAERVYAAERTANEAPALAMSKRLRTLYTNLKQAVAKQEELETVLTKRARLINNFGTDVVDKVGDLVQYDDASLADFDAVVMTQYQIVAAIAEAPATKLLGTTPKGFNSSGDYEADSYRETLGTMQDDDMSPLITMHHRYLMLSDVIPKFPEMADKTLQVVWNPIDVPKDKERAEINLAKAQTDAALVDAGGIDPSDVRARVAADPDSGYVGIAPREGLEPQGDGEDDGLI